MFQYLFCLCSHRNIQMMTSQWLGGTRTTQRCHWLQQKLLMNKI